MDNNRPPTKTQLAGFSLLELVVVIALLGTLAVFAVSRFVGPSGFAEYTYQARIIAALRNMQQRAMQDSRSNYCFQIIFVPSARGSPAFGPPSLDYSTGNELATCDTSIDFSTPEYLRSDAGEITDDGISLDVRNGGTGGQTLIGFDSLGRPSSSDGACSSGCAVTLSGESTVQVCIESQGYIHAC